MIKLKNSYRIIHTADWHLGKPLHDLSRVQEHEKFLDWLLDKVKELEADALLIAGDVFDIGLPAQKVLRQWYDFVKKLKQVEGCRLVVIGGNHDSPLQLESATPVLELLDVRVDGRVKEDPVDRILLLPDSENPQVAVAMIPYLRDADLRVGTFGEDSKEIRRKVGEGIGQKYEESARVLDQYSCPAVATGHLTVSGMKNSDSEQAIIGGIEGVSHKLFPERFGYVALGHLHRPQSPDGHRVRYSGSPIPLSFSEAEDKKEVRVLDVTPDGIENSSLPVPPSRNLVQLVVAYDDMERSIREFSPESYDLRTWVEIKVQNPTFTENLNEEVRAIAKGEYDVIKVVPDRGEEAEKEIRNRDEADYEFILNDPSKVFECLLNDRGVQEGKEQERLTELFESLVRIEREEGSLEE